MLYPEALPSGTTKPLHYFDRPPVARPPVRGPARGRLKDARRILYRLAGDGKVNQGGIPKNPLVKAVVSQWSDMYLASLPVGLQLAIFTPMAALARAMGSDKKLEVYLTAS